MDRFYIFEKDMKKQGCNSLICDILFGDFPRKDRAEEKQEKWEKIEKQENRKNKKNRKNMKHRKNCETALF